ncbi:MAG: glycosyltransferase N-terminal domain-containing protein, partial [Bacteroidota bacterium]
TLFKSPSRISFVEQVRLRRICYRGGIYLYGLLIHLASLFSTKARLWVQGRANWKSSIDALPTDRRWVWMHCASLGEFEQGRNLVDRIKAEHPEFSILITFFSPSGYVVRHNYPQADAVRYLPLDTPANARYVIDHLQPAWVLWIRYEFWLEHLRVLAERAIPHVLVAVRLNEQNRYLKGFLAPLYQAAFKNFTHIFTQDEATREQLVGLIPPQRLTVSADTRFDRVLSNVKQKRRFHEIENFIGKRLCLMGGSVWPTGEKMLVEAFSKLALNLDCCLILAPHEISDSRLQAWEDRWSGKSIRYSNIGQLRPSHSILWIDNVGMLAELYQYADLAYVGGGWGSGLHNILEPSVFGCPILFGPKYHRFPEAQDLIDAGGAFSFQDQSELNQLAEELLSSPEQRSAIRQINQSWVRERAGATEKIMQWCIQQGWLSAKG